MGLVGFLLITSKFDVENYEIIEQKDECTLITVANETSIKLVSSETKQEEVLYESFTVAIKSLKYWHTLAIGFFHVCRIW